MNTLFCKRLKMLRKENGKTQLDVAKMLHVNRSTYGAYESGKIMPPAEKCKALADYFRVSLEFLLGYGNTRERQVDSQNAPDVSDLINDVLHHLENDQNDVSFDGEKMSAEAREILATSLENALRMAKLIKKGMDQD